MPTLHVRFNVLAKKLFNKQYSDCSEEEIDILIDRIGQETKEEELDGRDNE